MTQDEKSIAVDNDEGLELLREIIMKTATVAQLEIQIAERNRILDEIEQLSNSKDALEIQIREILAKFGEDNITIAQKIQELL